MAEPNLVPRTNKGASIGTALKQWAHGFFGGITIDGKTPLLDANNLGEFDTPEKAAAARDNLNAETRRMFNVRDYGDNAAAVNQAITDASEEGGEVYFPPGNYELSGLSLKNGVSYRGAGIGVTVISLPPASQHPMFVADGVSSTAVSGLAIRDMTLDGVDSEANGIDVSGIDGNRFPYMECRNVRFLNFDRAYNGTNNDRWPYFENCHFTGNNVAIYSGEHPILSNCDIRSNDIGITGRLNDLRMTGGKINRCRIGIKNTDANVPINNSSFIGVGFYKNTELALELGTNNLVSNCFFTGNASNDVGVLIKDSYNFVEGNVFGQTGVSGDSCFELASVLIDSDGVLFGLQLTNNRFTHLNAVGVGILQNNNQDIRSSIISSNIFNLRSCRAIEILGSYSYSSITANVFTSTTGNDIGTDAVVTLHSSLTGTGYLFTGNLFRYPSDATIGAFLRASLRSCIVKDNYFWPLSQAAPAIDIINQDGDTLIKDNFGHDEE